MGTVVEKIRYIAGTKSAIRSAILKKGVEVGDEVTFRAYAEKIAEIEGGQSAAAYVFENATMAVDFPREALTSEADNYFYGTGSDQLAAMKAYLDAGNEAAYWGEYAASWQVLQNSETWSGAPLANTNVAFVFKNAVYPQAFHSRIGSTEWSLHATNDWEVFTAYLQNGASPEFMTTLIDSGESTNTTGGKDVPVDGSRAFKYYVFKYTYVWSNIYNMSLKTLAGNVSCALSSANMTPEVKVYLTDYMRLITQPFYCEGKVIPSQTLVMKPYEEGGNLINYTDDGSAVDLKMYLLTGADKPALYLLSPDDTFERPEGYADMTEVADLSLPAHIVKKEIVSDFEQPVLTGNGTFGGDSFAVKADSEYSDSYRAAWKAFDGNTVLADTGNDQWHSYSGQPHWLAFYNPYPLKVSSVTVYNGGDNVLPLDWKFQVSDNGTTWTDVASGTNTNTTAGSSWSFDITSPGWHKYHRFYTSSGQGRDGEYLGLTELQITALEKAERWVMGGA